MGIAGGEGRDTGGTVHMNETGYKSKKTDRSRNNIAKIHLICCFLNNIRLTPDP